jgi:hypothetical protein
MQSLLASKPVERSDGVVFSSATQAAKAVNIHISCISKACQGKIKTSAGYGWRYLPV